MPNFGVVIHWLISEPPLLRQCPTCKDPGTKPPLLSAEANLEGQATLHVLLLECPACGCAFAADAPVYDYEGQPADALSIETYVESGAGLWPIVRTLARLRLPAGANYLEIGCGFGFGLDFARRAQGWHGIGIDPSPLAAAGREMLGLPIESRYFQEADASGQADCILASEVLEHIADPIGFLAMLRGALTANGILVLTTPDRAALRREAPHSVIVPVLSVGAHLVLQTAGSLRLLLTSAGFAHVEVDTNGAQLVAYASAAPLDLEREEAPVRAAYRHYLRQRAASAAPGGTLWWGFAARAYQEAVADHDTAEAALFWPALSAACQQRFGFPLENPPSGTGCSLAALGALVPKALPTLLYARALERLQHGEPMAALSSPLETAALAAADLNAALAAVGAADLAALQAGAAARAVLAALAADIAAPDALEALERAIADDPGSAGDLARRSFAGLVNAGDFAMAKTLRARWDVGEAILDVPDPNSPMPAPIRDMAFCLGIALLQQPGEEQPAIRRFSQARAASERGGDLWWAALRGECVALDRLQRHEETNALLSEAPDEDIPDDMRRRRDAETLQEVYVAPGQFS